MGERWDCVDDTNSGRNFSGFGLRNGENKRPFSQHTGAEEREGSLLMRRGNSNEGQFREEVSHGEFRLQTLAQSSDRGLKVREPDSTSSRFQWKNFLPESRNLRVDGVKEDFQGHRLYDDYSRKYDRLVEKSLPTETERIRSLPAYSQGVGEYMRLPRNLSGPVLGDDKSFRGRDYSPHQDREMSRRTCDERSFPRLYSHGNSLIATSRLHSPSQGTSRDTPRGLRREIYCPSDACVNGNNDQPVRHDDHQKICTRAGTNIHPFLNEALNCSREYIRSIGRRRDYSAQESPKFRRLRSRELLEDNYDKAEHVHGEQVANYASDHTLQRPGNLSNCQKLVLRENRLQGFGDASEKNPPLDDYGVRSYHEPRFGDALQGKPPVDNYVVRRHYREPQLGDAPQERPPLDNNYGVKSYREPQEKPPLDNYGVISYHEPWFGDVSQEEPPLDNYRVRGEHRFGDASQERPPLDNYGVRRHYCEPQFRGASQDKPPLDKYDVRRHYCEPQFGGASQEKPPLDNYGVRRYYHEPQYEGLGLVPRGSYHQCEIQAIENHEALAHEEVRVCEIDNFCKEQKYYVTGQQGRVFITDEDTQEIMESVDFHFSENHIKMPKRKHVFDGTESWRKRRATARGSKDVLSSHNNVPSVKSVSHHRDIHRRENIGVSKTETEHPFGGLSEALQNRLSKPEESGRSDIQKRLKYPHIVPPPCHPQPHNVWRKGPEQQNKSSIKSLDASQSQEDDIDHLKLMVKPAEKDLPEDSEDFKRQVHECFLKCLQLLTANSGRYRRFKEQGKAGSLKCITCLSSKEFMDTKSIATHAFASPKVGFRAQHLGFHRAICVLMGWDSSTAPNGHWVCQSLPDSDSWALKEDVIIWPPVVIVHKNYDHNGQLKISTEHLVTMLRNEGFDEGKTKVCQGKAGSADIMVVKFSGTLSGLQEAERLHNIFAEKNHGRNGLLQATSKVTSSEDPQSQVQVNKLEDAFHGYLGIIEDSNKLHYNMKRHCCAKSKKGICSFADITTQ